MNETLQSWCQVHHTHWLHLMMMRMTKVFWSQYSIKPNTSLGGKMNQGSGCISIHKNNRSIFISHEKCVGRAETLPFYGTKTFLVRIVPCWPTIMPESHTPYKVLGINNTDSPPASTQHIVVMFLSWLPPFLDVYLSQISQTYFNPGGRQHYNRRNCYISGPVQE